MKKMIAVLVCLLFLTGCKNTPTCSKTTQEDGYRYDQKAEFNVDKNGYISSSNMTYTMIFESKEDASINFNVMSELEQNYDVTQSGNKVIIKSSQDYSDYKHTKEEVIADLEKNGYTCK